ncbi:MULTISPECIES: iron chelate uptake ABC transporter family permease subunit [unclassified Erwinia]|uniref:FecCD family ABC transporter permease n=1 Tax=unclassified Erwinia TaxID=2622719 RepID=UPI0006F6FD78|nr:MULTISPECIES: iron chelate uptake ABC transporter family permease subunit [unclassified Erwinia]KQN53819.1 ABC transporter permease [Erwinia sp. Leaf53]PLV62299.1 ABC transporter permease [Erwinia sp. B116]
MKQEWTVSGSVLRWRGVSLRYSARNVTVCAALLLLALVMGCYAMTVGRLPISAGQLFSALSGHGDGGMRDHIVRNIRLPRVLVALFVGAALGVSGALFQSISRNVLGSPDIIGFTTGAASGALLQIVLFDGGTLQVVLWALCGGLFTALVVWLLARQNGTLRGYQLILTGIGVGAILHALNGLLLVKGDLDNSVSANLWLAGTTAARSWDHALPVMAGFVLLLPLILIGARRLKMMEMGDDLSSQLGIPVERMRALMLFAGVLLAAVATSATGPIAFVALAAPQLVVRLTRSQGIPVMGAALMGACLLMLADLLIQLLPAGLTVPVGRMTGIIGGLYLLWLLTRTRQI